MQGTPLIPAFGRQRQPGLLASQGYTSRALPPKTHQSRLWVEVCEKRWIKYLNKNGASHDGTCLYSVLDRGRQTFESVASLGCKILPKRQASKQEVNTSNKLVWTSHAGLVCAATQQKPEWVKTLHQSDHLS